MNLAFVPDLVSLAMLVAILLLVRREHSEERSNAWLLGLFITLVEGAAHTFYSPVGIPAWFLHVIVIDCYALAGMVFVWASSDRTLSRQSRLLYLTLNTLPLLAFVTPYGLNLRYPQAYLPGLIAGGLIGVGTAIKIRRNWLYAVLQGVGWSVLGVVIAYGRYRNAVYWAIGTIYAIAAINFARRLQRRSTGRLAIVAGFSVWSLFFFCHPWIVGYPVFTDIASHIWNLQKLLISIGMILVMLEEQAHSNAYLAHHDELTGLPNRRMFAARLNLALEQADRTRSSLALVVLDLNGFKQINDTLGHLAGDQVLRDVAGSLRKNVRATDTVARMGGDEFIILAEGITSEASAGRFSEAIRGAVERPVFFQGKPVNVSASIGVALYPDDARDAIKLLRLADQRMYHGKKGPLSVPAPVEPAMAALPPA